MIAAPRVWIRHSAGVLLATGALLLGTTSHSSAASDRLARQPAFDYAVLEPLRICLHAVSRSRCFPGCAPSPAKGRSSPLVSMLGGDTPPAERWPLFLLDDPPASDLDHGLYDGSPDEPPPALTDSERLWSFTPFVGMNDDDRFVEIVTFRGGDFQNSYIAGAALARHFATTFDHLQWEGEVSGYHHWGIQDHWEMNLALVARWTWFPWDRYLDTNVAFGQGVSWASDRPPLERETRQLLNHLVAEVEVIPLRDRPVSLVVRAHHRSGVFGLYGARGGSNFVNLGVRLRF